MTHRPPRATRAIVLPVILALAALGCIENRRPSPECIASSEPTAPAAAQQFEPSLVYLDVSAYAYQPFLPWKQPDLVQWSGYGTAVGPYQILTTAWNVRDAADIKVRRHGRNAFLSATVDRVDYEANLALLSLDPNTAGLPLTPLTFTEAFEKDADVAAYWLTGAGQVKTSRGRLDRAEVENSTVSYARMLQLIVKETGTDAGRGRLFTMNNQPIGLACWADSDTGQTGLVPAETIRAFLADAADGPYQGFAAEGFEAEVLRDPTLRRHLNLPDDLTDGVYISKVHTLGTGSECLQPGDVLLAVNDQPIDAAGRFRHPLYEQLTYHTLITRLHAGDPVALTIWRDGQRTELTTTASNFPADRMLVPFYEYGRGPDYLVTAGYVFQRLTRPYLTMWGDDWSGKVPPHLYQYYRNRMFAPTDERPEIVLLSRVLPHPVNQGYHNLAMLVVKTVNGQPVRTLADLRDALTAENPTGLDVIEFEEHRPTLVIPRENRSLIDTQINQVYGIPNPERIHRRPNPD